MPGGSLAVPGGDEVVPVINKLAKKFANVVLTQDWHSAGHRSFASSHAAKKPFDVVGLEYGDQILWPDHCVQGIHGARLHAKLKVAHARLVLRYSAFAEADRKTPTWLGGYLRERGIDCIYVCGLAMDFCVAWTALDARKLGFKVTVIEDACRAIDTQGSPLWLHRSADGVCLTSRLNPSRTLRCRCRFVS